MTANHMAARSSEAIILDQADNMATAIVALQRGHALQIGSVSIVLVDDIAFGHKFALQDLAPGDYAVKYGAPIARVTSPIPRGGHAHIHNMEDIVQEVRAKHRA